MASPVVAGIVALMFAEAAARGVNLSIDQTIQILIGSARRNPPGGAAWNARYGNGRVSAAKAIQGVIATATGGGTATGAKKASNARGSKKKK